MMNNEIHFELNRTKKEEIIDLINQMIWIKPGFDPANVREKLPDDNSGILTPSSISSIRKNSIGIG